MASPAPTKVSSDGKMPVKDASQGAFVIPENKEFYESGEYKSLSIKSPHIRLLRLLPGSGDEAIECDLVQNVPVSTRQQRLRTGFFGYIPSLDTFENPDSTQILKAYCDLIRAVLSA